MKIIAQDKVNIQEILALVLHTIPVIVNKDAEAYILIKDICSDLEEFINTGKADVNEISVFTEAYEKEIIANWQVHGYEYKYRNQIIEYMRHRISVRYLTVSNPRTDLSLSLIPWFMLPGRPYPVFLYAYADWHYSKTEHQSMRLSAYAAGRVFGVESFNKSTLCRIRKDEQFSGMHMDMLQDGGEPVKLPDTDVATLVVKLLENYSEIRKYIVPDKEEQHSPPTNGTEYIAHALDSVPVELSRVIKDHSTTRQGICDTRKRPTRRLNEKYRHLQRLPCCVHSSQLELIRKSFIAACRAAVMDTAVRHHKFLI